MSSISIQSCIRGTLTCPSFTRQKPGFRSFKTSLPVVYNCSSLYSSTVIDLRSRPIIRIQALSASAITESAREETSPESSTSAAPEESAPIKETEKVAAKAKEEPRLVLKFIWMEKNIGLGLDQAIPGHGTIPLSPYFFWPRKDAWEELKSTLESKPWISQKKMIILLNQATDIINLWQQSGGNLSSN